MLNLYEQTKNKISKHRFIFCLVTMITIMFLVLYSKFIFNDFAYVYGKPGDWGGDTVHQYFAIYTYLSRMIHEGNIDIFSLNLALGESFLAKIISMFNIFDIIALLFPPRLIDIGILISTYFKYIVIGIFSYLYFNFVFKNKKVSLITSLLWTFCSYTVVWGQHYQFCTNMANFTVFMYLLQKWLMGNKNIWKVFVLCMGIFLLNSYYFFYMFGIFSAIYTVFFMLIEKKTLKAIFLKLLQLLGMAILALLISAVFAIPVILSFTNSIRSDIAIDGSYLFSEDSLQILSILVRALNPNILGSGYVKPTYTGFGNFYENSPIFVSILAMPAIIYLLVSKKNFLLKLGIILGFISILVCHLSNFIFTFSDANRWLFILTFLQVLAIGIFIKDYMYKINIKERIISSLLGSVVIILIIYIVLNDSRFDLDENMIKISLFCLIFWWLILLVPFKNKINNGLILIMVFCELALINYPLINNRGMFSRNELYNAYYDNYMLAAEYLKSIDPSLYRVDKVSNSVFLNDALVQNYYGNDSYISVHTKEEWNLAQIYDGCLDNVIHPNYINFDNIIFNTFMGNKYILSTREIAGLDSLDVIGNVYIYLNPYYMGFGYIYDHSIDIDFENYSELENITFLAEGYSIENNTHSGQKVNPNVKTEKMINKYIGSINAETEIKNEVIYSEGKDDMQLLFRVDKNQILSSISFDLIAEKESFVEIFCFDEKNRFTSYRKKITAGENHVDIDFYNLGNIITLRIDSSEFGQNISLSNIKLKYIDGNNFEQHLNKIKNNGSVESSYKNSTYIANIDSKVENGMMMIPITYDRSWKATIDGEKVDVYKINGGLIGVKVPQGKHEVIVQYCYPYFYQGILISSFGIIIYLYMIFKKKV